MPATGNKIPSLSHFLFLLFLDEDDDVNLTTFKEKLDRIMYEKSQTIENKKLFFCKRQSAQAEMEESALKKRNTYGADLKNEQNWNAICMEERELHEAYQFCIREYKVRHVEEITAADDPLSPQGSIKKKRPRRTADNVSVYRGEKDYYEKLMESLPNEEPEFGGGPVNIC